MVCYVMCCHGNVMLCYVMLFHFMLYYFMLCYVMLCHVTLSYVMLCHVMGCYVMLCTAMLYYAMLCYGMLCYVMLCYGMISYVLLCYVNATCVRARYVMLWYGLSTCQIEYLWRELILRGGNTNWRTKSKFLDVFGFFWRCLDVLDFFGRLRSASNALVEEVRLTEPNYTCSEEKRKAPKISNAIWDFLLK